MMIIIGDDWAQDHHDMELMSEDGDVLARFRVQEDADGLAELLTRIGEHVSDSDDDGHVLVGIERDNGPWVTAYAVTDTWSTQSTRSSRHGVDHVSPWPVPRVMSVTRTYSQTWCEPTGGNYVL